MPFAIEVIVLVVLLAVCWRFLGSYLEAVYAGRVHWLGFVERPIYRLAGVDPDADQSWRRYALSVIGFSAVAVLLSYLLLRIQGHLPLNPEHLGDVSPALAWNTAVSFVTNTNWQNYAGGSTMTYFSQMAVLAVQNFVSPAVGLAVAIALVRGFARKSAAGIGNFWADLVRGLLYVFLPIAFVFALVFVGQGAVQTLAGPAHVHDALSGFTQVIHRGPVASQEAIKQLGTNGGGFFNANGADPFENPTGLTNFLSIFLLLVIPVASTYTFGKMVGSVRQGVAVLAAMAIFFFVWLGFTTYAEAQPNPAVAIAGQTYQPQGNTEGKEARFGVRSSVLYNVASTQTSTGSVDSANDSYTPIGGLGLMTGMMLGEVSPGGVGSGLYTMLLFAVVAVFIGGLMVGRTPEYLGKKIQAREVKLAALGVLVMPLVVLILAGIATSLHAGRAQVLNHGPQGFSEILYSVVSQTNNNGSAFAGLNANTPFYNVTGGIEMLLGRFAVIVPVLALAGTLAAKPVVPASSGTFPTDRPLFVALLVGVVVIVGGLTFFPAVALGPVVEQLAHGRLF
jgi:K+-transporting ATPase ATPase A chain